MKADDGYLFRDPGTDIPHDPSARCRRCNGTDRLIEGDGPPTCRDCIESLGAIANDPHVATQRILGALQERHGDVVTLVRVASHANREARLRWDWTKDWPVGAP